MTTSGTAHTKPDPSDNRYARVRPLRGGNVTRAAAMIVWTLCIAYVGVFAQNERMAVEGSIQLDASDIPETALIRVLRGDGTVVRTLTPYPSNPSRFGVRFSSADGFRPGDLIGFRVVLSRRDSFEARIAGDQLYYTPSSPQELTVTRVLLFRNHPPVIRRSLSDTTLSEHETLRFKTTAQDVDGDTIVFRFVSAPRGMWMDSRNGFVTWTPDYDQAGTYPVVLGVSDGQKETFSAASVITVRNVNRPPRIVSVPEDQEVAEGESVPLQVEAVEEDGDSLRYYLVETNHKALLYSHTGLFTWRPGYEAAGRYSFRVIVSDGSANDTSGAFTIVVRNTNRPPVFDYALADTLVTEGDSIAQRFHAEDPDGDTVRYRLELAPDGVDVDSTGLLTWRPGYDQSGSYVIILSANDGAGSSEAVARVVVMNHNRPPSFVGRAYRKGNGIQEFPEGSFIDLRWPPATDPDTDDSLSYAIRLVGNGLDTTIAGITDTSIGVLSRGRFQLERTYRWFVSVNDGYTSVTAPDTFAFRIISMPIPEPEMALQGETIFSFTLSTGGQDADPGLTSITYSLAERSMVRIAVFSMIGEKISTLEDGEHDAGTYETTFNTGALASGIYMFKLEAHPLEGIRLRDFVSTRKMVLVK